MGVGVDEDFDDDDFDDFFFFFVALPSFFLFLSEDSDSASAAAAAAAAAAARGSLVVPCRPASMRYALSLAWGVLILGCCDHVVEGFDPRRRLCLLDRGGSTQT